MNQPNDIKPAATVFKTDTYMGVRYHVLLGDRLVMNLTEKERDAHLAAYAAGRIYSTYVTRYFSETERPQSEEGFTTYIDNTFVIKYDADKDTARILNGALFISGDIAFAKWLMPQLEARGFSPRLVQNPAHKIGIGVIISGVIVFIAALMLVLAKPKDEIEPDSEAILIDLLGSIGHALGPGIIITMAIVLVLTVLWLSLDFKVADKKIFEIKKGP